MTDFGDEWDNVYRGELAPKRWKMELGLFFGGFHSNMAELAFPATYHTSSP
jgi:hypothetical protein